MKSVLELFLLNFFLILFCLLSIVVYNLFNPPPFCLERDYLAFCKKHSAEYDLFLFERKKITDRFLSTLLELNRYKEKSLSSFGHFSDFSNERSFELYLNNRIAFLNDYDVLLKSLFDDERSEIKSLCMRLLNDEKFCSDPK